MGTQLCLLIFDAPDAVRAHRLASLLIALSASSWVDRTSWSIDAVHTLGAPDPEELRKRARRERWNPRLGERVGMVPLGVFLLRMDERGLGLEADGVMGRCRVVRRERWWGERERPLDSVLSGDLEVDFQKVGMRYFLHPEYSNERLLRLDARIAEVRLSGPAHELERLLRQRAETLVEVLDERNGDFLDRFVRFAGLAEARSVRVWTSDRPLAPACAPLAWYRDEASLLEDVVLTARWLEEQEAVELLGAREHLTQPGLSALLRAVDLAAVQRFLSEERPGVLRNRQGFLLVNPEMSPVKGSIEATFLQLARAASRGTGSAG
ncbi:hypothetical protein SAMN05443572_105491 [Myxococcus fulvus]|nr:hypothetical protein [Myxococcus fulvus]SEU16670.1 hypothetical protein SAMN05443572_105491 [Myxococcus fulvus]